MGQGELMRSILLVLCLGLAGAAGAGIAGTNETGLGENLLGEACEMRPRDDLSPESGLPVDQRILCAGNPAGQLSYARFDSTGTQDPAALRAALYSQYRGSRIEKQVSARLSCAQPQWLEGGADRPVAIFACQSQSGGWPQLVVLSASRGIVALAEGSPALVPVLLKIAAVPEATIAAVSGREALQARWGKPITLATSADLERFKRLNEEARNASSTLDFVEAETGFRQALELQVRLLSANDPAIANTLMDLALTVSNQGKAEEAQALLRRAEIIAQTSPFESDRARLATYRGYEAANRGDVAAALQEAQFARLAWRKLAATTDGAQSLLPGETSGASIERAELAMALDFEANMILRNGDALTAGALASEALQLLAQLDSAPRWWKADVMSTLGEVSIAQGRLSAAETYFASALAIRKQIFGDGPITLPILTALARAYQSEGMNSSAIITFREVFRIARTHVKSAAVLSHEQLVPFGAAITAHAETLAEESARQGLYAEAFDAFQLTRSGVVDKTIAKAQARLSHDDPKINALVAELQSAQRRLEVARADLAREQSLPDQERSSIAESRLQQAMAAQWTHANTLDRKLAAQHPAYHQLANPRPLQLIELRKRLGDREALVSFIIGRKQSFVQLTRRQGNYVARIDQGEAQLSASVKALRRALEIQAGAINEFDLAGAHELYQSLLGRLAGRLQGVEHLIIAPAGPLASLPFGLLVTEAPRQGSYSGAAWLGQRHTISHVPSIQAFAALRSSAPRRAAPKLMLAIGNPLLEGTRADGPTPRVEGEALAAARDACRPEGPMSSDILRALSPLPETAAELNTVAKLLGVERTTLLLGAQASEANLRTLPLHEYRLLYFATHGLLPGELRCQAEPGLVLSPPGGQATRRDHDGLLDASEIAAMKLNADLVVLSACNTAGGGRLGGEALTGLAESFFFAGARSLVVSHWQVPSAATAQLMGTMFGRLGPELKGGASAALKEAQAQMISQQKTAHPFFWAAFVVIGDGIAVPRGDP